MKKGLSLISLCVVLMMMLAGCGKEITLKLSYGDRTGQYTGDLVDGVPDGRGKFTTTNEQGETWTYEGEFKKGHFEGQGTTTWKNGTVETGTYKDDVIVPLKGDEIKTLFTNPEKFKNHCVEVIGRVFTAPEYADNAVAVQMWTDPENFANNVIVYIYDKDFKVKQDDYLRIKGLVGDVFKGKNALGSDVSAPTINAREYEVISYTDATAPTQKTVEVDQTKEQHGYSITVQKVEFAKGETRVYFKVANNGSDKFNMYSFDTKITQDGKQYAEQSNWNADYLEVQTGLLVGNTTEGIIAFPEIEQKSFSIVTDARSENYREDFEPYKFDIEVGN